MNATDAGARMIAEQLRALGVRAGGLLLVHSSLKSLGVVPGGAPTVIAGLQAALGPDGTLFMPALSYATVGPSRPWFDVQTTPVCVGLIPETFRATPGVVRSLHPTHSVCARGPAALELIERHHLDTTPVGPMSPMRLLAEQGGQVLMLGCGLRPNTSMHGVEELVEPPYLFQREPAPLTLVDELGVERTTTHRVHDFRGWEQRYDRIEPLMPAGSLVCGRVMSAECHLLDARTMWKVAEAALRSDPLCFVDRARL